MTRRRAGDLRPSGLAPLRPPRYASPVSTPFIITIALAWYAATSAACFAAYALDKSAARRGTRRVPERTLHALELLGGWPGALAASALLRHKSAKTAFRLVRALIVAAHVSGWGVAAWLAAR